MYTLNCKGRLVEFNEPKVMGVINVTPDSFYAGSRVSGLEAVVQQAERMINDGTTFLDIGGLSTRPGSKAVESAEEVDRVVPAIKAILHAFPQAIISIDTYRSTVAIEAVNAGASIVNDISGGSLDIAMLETVAALRVPFICMHTKGSPENMQSLAHYDDVVKEVLDYLILKVEACKAAGIKDIIIDAGFGFAKTIEHNFMLLQKLEVFKILGRPLLLGISRKSTIYKTLGITSNEALNGTTVLNTIGLTKGVNILRVHDVKEAVEVVKLYQSMEKKIK